MAGTDATLRRAAALWAEDRLEAAEAVYRDALETDPDSPELLYNLGSLLLARGRYPPALAPLSRAVELVPASAPAWNNLGLALRGLDRPGDAVEAFATALRHDPRHAGACNNLGLALMDQDRHREAAGAFARAAGLDPDFAEAHRNLGNLLRRLPGHEDTAEDALRRAIALRPDWAMARADLAALLLERQRHAEAIAPAREALALDPDLTPASATLARALLRCGRDEEADRALQQGLERGGDAGLAVRRVLTVPVMPGSAAAIDAGRARCLARLAELEAAAPALADPLAQVGMTPFYLAYHGRDDRPVVERLARLLLATCPDLGWTAPHCTPGAERRPGRLRLGVVSPNFVDGHTVGKLFIGLVAALPRDTFEVILFRDPAADEARAPRALAAADRVVALPHGLEAMRRAVAAEQPDILFYPDIGMAAETYYLAFARLAPVQCCTWGHPVTTGIPAMDYFISSEHLDPPDDAADYSETLVRPPRVATGVPRPPLDRDALPGRAALGLPEEARLYVCTQTLFKLHPDFDRALAGILARDPEAVPVFIEGPHAALAERFRRRLADTSAAAAERALFLPGLSFPEFLGLSATADVLLDSFPFCGGNTSYEAFAYGSPIVTLPRCGLRGHITAALYRQMGIFDLIAGDEDHYAALAVRVATDGPFAAGLRSRILAAAPALFEDAEAARWFAGFLVEAAGESAKLGG